MLEIYLALISALWGSLDHDLLQLLRIVGACRDVNHTWYQHDNNPYPSKSRAFSVVADLPNQHGYIVLGSPLRLNLGEDEADA